MVPFRQIFETMGAEVQYDNGKVTAVKDDTEISFVIGERNYLSQKMERRKHLIWM